MSSPSPSSLPRRTLGDILHEIGERSPATLVAFQRLAEFVLATLQARDG